MKSVQIHWGIAALGFCLATGGASAAQAQTCNATWQVVPSLALQSGGTLAGVTAIAADSVWAVGSRNTTNGLLRTLIERWNGSQWAIVPSPNPLNFSSDQDLLAGVAAVSATDIWAVGSHIINGTQSQGLALHWNGRRWSVVPTPSTTLGNALVGITAIATNNVWAVGTNGNATLVEHWDGSQWSIVPSRNVPGAEEQILKGVTAVAANDIWAVGSVEPQSGPTRTLTEHWDGSQWSIVPSPNPGALNNVLNGTTAIATNNVWAVGYGDGAPAFGTLTEQWNGSQWQVIPSADASGQFNILTAVNAPAADNIWTVGYTQNVGLNQTLSEHWDSSQWQVVPTPNVGTGNNQLLAVTSTGTNIWAVGFTGSGTSAQPLIALFCNGQSG